MSAIASLAVLVFAASFGSWALSRWLASPRRLSHHALSFAVGGLVCLSGAVGLAIFAVVQSWPALTPAYVAPSPALPTVEPRGVVAAEPPQAATPVSSAVEHAASTPPPGAADDVAALKLAAQRAFHDGRYLHAAQLGEELLALLGDDADVRVLTANAYFLAQRFEDAERHIEAAIGARLDANGDPPLQWLRFQWSSGARLSNRLERARVQHALLQNYPQHRRDFAGLDERLLVTTPHDTPPRAESRFVLPGPLLTEWSTTECVGAVRDRQNARRMFLDNECERVVALVFASCPHSTPACNAWPLSSTGWVYEADGLVLTTPEQRPLTDRISARGPLIAPTYALDMQEGRRIRYLACPLTDAEALAILREPGWADEARPLRLRTALERDACYARVLELSRAGRESRRSPDALLAGRA